MLVALGHNHKQAGQRYVIHTYYTTGSGVELHSENIKGAENICNTSWFLLKFKTGILHQYKGNIKFSNVMSKEF